MRVPLVEERKALITGCSTGIGRAAARLLRDRGWQVIPTARKDRDLDGLLREGFPPVRLDLADTESVVRAAEKVHEAFEGKIGAVVNNAGFGQVGAVEDVSRAGLRRQFEVNVFGMQELTNRFIPVLRKQGWGRIVNVSSVYGRVTAPLMGAYCASKYAVEALSDAMRVEMRGSGVAVSIVEPGPIVTAFRQNAVEQSPFALDPESAHFAETYARKLERARNGEARNRRLALPPEAVARRIHHAAESRRPRIRYIVTVPAYFGAFLRRFAPASWVDRILAADLRE